MANLVFLASFGMDVKTVEISNVSGAGGAYHIYVDHYYNGAFWKTQFGYAFHLPEKTQLTSDDILIIEEMIEDLGKQKDPDHVTR